MWHFYFIHRWNICASIVCSCFCYPELFGSVVLLVVEATVALVVVIACGRCRITDCTTFALIVVFVFNATNICSDCCWFCCMPIGMFAVDTLLIIIGAVGPNITLQPIPGDVPIIVYLIILHLSLSSYLLVSLLYYFVLSTSLFFFRVNLLSFSLLLKAL